MQREETLYHKAHCWKPEDENEDRTNLGVGKFTIAIDKCFIFTVI